MRLLVLAGGFGTRLKSVVNDVPKALAPVGSVPFLQLQIEHWYAQGIREFSFLLHHQADQIITFLQIQKSIKLKDCHVNWLIEPTPMDTGGAIAYAVNQLNLSGDFLATNADTWLGGGISEMMQAVCPAIAVVNLPDVSRYGQVHFNEHSSVISFTEKTNHKSAGWINAGLSLLCAELFQDWNGKPFSLERDLYALLVKRSTLSAVPLQTDFIDIGIPSEYFRFCRWLEEGKQIKL